MIEKIRLKGRITWHEGGDAGHFAPEINIDDEVFQFKDDESLGSYIKKVLDDFEHDEFYRAKTKGEYEIIIKRVGEGEGEKAEEKKSELKEQLPIVVDLPKNWTLKWESGLSEGSIVRSVYDNIGATIDREIVSCELIPEAIPNEVEIKAYKKMTIDEWRLRKNEVGEDE